MRTLATPSASSVTLRALAATVAVGLLVVLAGCAPVRSPIESSAPPSASPSVSPSPSATATSGSNDAAPFSIDCATLLSDQDVFAFNQNFSADDNYTPDAASLAAAVVAHGGTACAWINQSGGDLIEIAVATPSPADLAALTATAAAGTPVAGLGDAAYVTQSGEYGQLQVFRGPYWLTATSLYFSAGGEANLLVAGATAHLP